MRQVGYAKRQLVGVQEFMVQCEDMVKVYDQTGLG